jgi:hypothetical protein
VRRLRLLLAAPALVITLAACRERAPEVVDGDLIVVAASPAMWDRLGPRIRRALEPTPFALPDANAFELTPVDPAGETWPQARRARQLLLIGSPADPWVVEALERRNLETPAVPSQTELRNVWAGDQHVLLLLLPADDTRLSERQVSDLRTGYDRRYREFVVEQLYFPEGPNNALADTLQERGGFELLVPQGYAWTQQGDTYRFESPAGDSAGLQRHVLITWQSPIPEGIQSDALALLDWREQLSAEHYDARQSVDPTGVHGGPTTQHGSRAIQLLGSWRAGGQRGAFLMRGVVCPVQDRMYLLDGWMVAPDQGGQEEMVEIESILNSFRCGTAEG